MTSYDPKMQATAEWPEWTFIPTDLHGVCRYVLSGRHRKVLMDRRWYDADPDRALAFVLALLESGVHRTRAGGRTTRDDDELAEFAADVRLDRAGSRP